MDFLDALFSIDWIVRHWRASIGLALAVLGLYVVLGLHAMILGLSLVPVGLFFVFWELFVYFRDTDQ